MAHRPADEAGVGADDPAFLVLVFGGAHEVGGQQRRDEARDEQREEHGEGDRQAELLEVLTGDAAHEADRREDGDDGDGDGDDGEADLVGGLERGAVGGLAHAHVAHDVLDLDDGVVDEDAGDDGDGEQGDEVEREAGSAHGPECRDDRQRQGDGGNDRRAQVAQEQEHDEDGEHGAFDQRLHRRFVGAEGVVDRIVDAGDGGAGVLGLDLLDLGAAASATVMSLAPLPRVMEKATTDLPSSSGEGARFFPGIGDGAEFIEPDLAAAWQGDGGRGEIGDGLLAGQRADCLLAVGDLAAAAGQVDVGGAQLGVDVAGGDAECEQAVGIERDVDFAGHAADAVDGGNAFDALQPRLMVSSTNQDSSSSVMDGACTRIGDDRQALDLDALDDRLVDGARQVAADACDGVLDVVEGAVGVDLEAELDHRHR